jgi:hypothetical protein
VFLSKVSNAQRTAAPNEITVTSLPSQQSCPIGKV